MNKSDSSDNEWTNDRPWETEGFYRYSVEHSTRTAFEFSFRVTVPTYWIHSCVALPQTEKQFDICLKGKLD